ncbi:hypothetical protein EVJ58_g8298 [Rhodofomes roseus]|uniref:Uncharacterized protein n=1 Tax=Rhodofomes roseus TaxID=34475 RepID=A0A4Y9XZ35_9APHY|nr:hypothetical protein EVJ58_g8298 [Rhodofomes roseus]
MPALQGAGASDSVYRVLGFAQNVDLRHSHHDVLFDRWHPLAAARDAHWIHVLSVDVCA